MGKPTGFLEYPRTDNRERSPKQRVGDFSEFHLDMQEEQRRLQGARCMDCGIPFCQSAFGCPIDNLIPEWNDLVFRGRYRDAYERLSLTNNFPEFTGLVCPAPCETACVLSISDPAVSIKANEAFIVETAFDNGWVMARPPAKRTGGKVAVIGCGPTGLAAADQLNRAGHEVTVYERQDRFGGLLTYGIPNMKLDKRRIGRRVDLMRAEGIDFVANAHIGEGDCRDVLSRFDAVVLAIGAGVPRDLPLPGRELKGVYYALDFLRANTKSLLDSGLEDGAYISARDRQMVVIGGGDTGNDCIGTAIRHGCRSLVNFEILPKPPNERSESDPWPVWPRILRNDYGHREAIHLFHVDPREYSILTKRFLGHRRVEAVETVRVEWVGDGTGRQTMRELPGTAEEYRADLVMLAMGFLGPEEGLIRGFGLETDQQGNIAAEYGRFQTSASKIFAAGDARRGQSLVVWAINEGRAVAREVDKFLTGDPCLP